MLPIQASPTGDVGVRLHVLAIISLIRKGDFTNILELIHSNLFEDIPQNALYFVTGLAHYELGNYQEAFANYLECLELCNRRGGRDRERGNISLCYIYLGDLELKCQCYQSAADWFKKAIQLYIPYPDPSSIARLFDIEPLSFSAIRIRYGFALSKINSNINTKDAVEQYEEAIAKACSDEDMLAAHYGLGDLYQSLGEDKKAISHYMNSLHWAHDMRKEQLSCTYINLGIAYQSLKELDKAEEYFKHALIHLGGDLQGQARVYGYYGDLLLSRKKYSEAIWCYDEVVDHSNDQSITYTARHGRGCAYSELAQEEMDKFWATPPSMTNLLPFYIRGPDFINSLASRYPEMVPPHIARFYCKGAEDLQKVVRYHEENIRGSSMGLISLFETVPYGFHHLQNCLVSQGKHTSALLVAEQSRARNFGEHMLKRRGCSLPHQLQSPLPYEQITRIISSKNNPVLYLSHTGARLLGWVFVPKDSEVKMTLFEVPLKEDQFNGMSFDYHIRNVLPDVKNQSLEHLYLLIAEPLLQILLEHTNIDKIHKVTVIPDNCTSLLPLSGLHHPWKGFLGDRISFQLMPSLLIMDVMDQLPDNVVRLPTVACIVGNPYNKEWCDLPHAKQEAEWVAHILKTTPILGQQATKEAVLGMIESAKVVHLAIHGSGSAGFLAFGATVLVSDIEKLNISPGLVVLTSCDSARGTITADGIQGMARAFILAGAQTVLTALWRVPDESAAVFMQFFYQYMVDGMESTLALHKAILSVRCFSKFSHYINWSGYQLTGRDVHFETTPTQILLQRLGPGTVFPRLNLVKDLEETLINKPCYTHVQILQGCSSVKPSEVMVDFIHSCHQYFSGGVFWINCKRPQFVSASVHGIEEEVNLPQVVSESNPVLLVLDNVVDSLPTTSEPLMELMTHRHTHLVLLRKNYHPLDKLIEDIDNRLKRGSMVHAVKPLTMIHSTQRIVYTIQQGLDFAPNNEDQVIFEKLAEFTSRSPVLVVIVSQMLLTYLSLCMRNDPSNFNHMAHQHLKRFTISLSLYPPQEAHVVGRNNQDISLVQPTMCCYNSLSKLINCELDLKEKKLLACLSVFGACPVPEGLVTMLYSLVCEGTPLPASQFHPRLRFLGFLCIHPLPVVIHNSVMQSDRKTELMYVPKCIATTLWMGMNNADKVFALNTSYRALSCLASSLQHKHFLLGTATLLLESYRLNSHCFEAEGEFEACYEEVHTLALNLSRP